MLSTSTFVLPHPCVYGFLAQRKLPLSRHSIPSHSFVSIDRRASHGGGRIDMKTPGSSPGSGLFKLRFNLNVELDVPSFVESLVRGPWDPDGELWRRQVEMATEVIYRSSGVVFCEQLAPVLTPTDPPHTNEQLENDETFMVSLLTELQGIQEVTDHGDILYIFPSLVGDARHKQHVGLSGRSTDLQERDHLGLEIPLFQELNEAASTSVFMKGSFNGKKILASSKGMIEQFGQNLVRAALFSWAAFFTVALFLSQLFVGGWFLPLGIGPAYLAWTAGAAWLERSRENAAQERDMIRRAWAEALFEANERGLPVCGEGQGGGAGATVEESLLAQEKATTGGGVVDLEGGKRRTQCQWSGDVIWRKRLAARSRAACLKQGGADGWSRQ